jgi:chromosome partitioning protein
METASSTVTTPEDPLHPATAPAADAAPAAEPAAQPDGPAGPGDGAVDPAVGRADLGQPDGPAGPGDGAVDPAVGRADLGQPDGPAGPGDGAVDPAVAADQAVAQAFEPAADPVHQDGRHDLSRVRDAADRLAATAVPPDDHERDLLPRVIALANQKGGVGKTTTAVNLGAALAELDYRVLLVDLDPQGNASTGLGLNLRDIDVSVYDVLLADAPLDDCIEPTSVRNLFVAPSTIDLAGAEIELVPVLSRENKLRRALTPVRDEFDYILIDCPPSLGLLTVNALAAADDVIVPIQCEYYALEGLGQLLKNVQLIQNNLNPTLRVRGIALTMFDGRTKLAEQVEGDVRRYFRDTVYRTVIPRSVRLSEAPSFGQPITTFDPVSRGAIAYRELAKEVSRGATRRSG